jgi:alkanesulfonate monooxygenase SsuD/methylene tetrahydromethanopterin reductase-like flavin-dependent oxidoreductase (luciferase family)
MYMLPTIPATLEEREALRPIGRNRERFQMLLSEVRELAILADETGFDCFSTTEHHFHSEGFEMSVQPMMLYADLAARTKNISFAPMALVLPASDPLRVAEQVAYLDHLTEGRVYGGFARGYQDRWVNILGQKTPVMGAPMDGGEADQRNKRVHEEYLDIIYKAWTNDVLRYKGEFYEVPFPYETGIERWPAKNFTAKYGAPGELDENGHIQGISVVPAPYQDPYPKSFQPFSVSESTMRYSAEHGTIPTILTGYPDDFKRLCESYRDTAAQFGRNLRLGESVGATRSLSIDPDRAKAWERMERTSYYSFQTYFSEFGFWEAFRLPGDEVKYPRPNLLPPEEWTMERFTASKYGLSGTVDDIKRELEQLHKVYSDDGALDWFILLVDQGLMPIEECREQVEIFANEIMPEFQD